MEITLPDGRKATVIGQVTDKLTKIRLEDGRESMWPTDKIQPPKEGEDTLKVVIIPAIDRLIEFHKDFCAISKAKEFLDSAVRKVNDDMNESEVELFKTLLEESIEDYRKKWGLT